MKELNDLEFTDIKNTHDRVPFAFPKTFRNRLKVIALLILTIAIFYIASSLMQSYLQSFAKVKPAFHPVASEVKSWQIVFSK